MYYVLLHYITPLQVIIQLHSVLERLLHITHYILLKKNAFILHHDFIWIRPSLPGGVSIFKTGVGLFGEYPPHV